MASFLLQRVSQGGSKGRSKPRSDKEHTGQSAAQGSLSPSDLMPGSASGGRDLCSCPNVTDSRERRAPINKLWSRRRREPRRRRDAKRKLITSFSARVARRTVVLLYSRQGTFATCLKNMDATSLFSAVFIGTWGRSAAVFGRLSGPPLPPQRRRSPSVPARRRDQTPHLGRHSANLRHPVSKPHFPRRPFRCGAH